MPKRKEPKRSKRKRKSPAQTGVAAAQRTLAQVIAMADPESAERKKR